MFTFKKEDCERRKHHLSDGRQLEISDEVCSARAAPGGIHCFAEKHQPGSGQCYWGSRKFLYMSVLATSGKQVCCMPVDAVLNLVRGFFLVRDNAMCVK